MTGDTHYDLEILAELAEGLLDDATAREVRGHLAICDPCGERLADLAAVREVLAAMPVPVMPMGVALRVDQALAAEAERFPVAPPAAPDWDRIMRDAPWENESPIKEAAHSVSPIHSRATSRRRRRWLTSVSAVAAAAAVIGGVALAVNVINTDGPSGRQSVMAEPAPASVIPGDKSAPEDTAAGTDDTPYPVGQSGYFYADAELNGPLVGYFGPQPGAGGTTSADPDLDRCIQTIAKKVGSTPIGVDKAYYNGNEAAIMVFWHNKAQNSVEVRVVNSRCKNMRKPGLATWN